MKPYEFHPQAADEYAEAVEYYAAVTPDLGARFYTEIERPARRALARKFPYSVVFRDLPDRIWIVAVMHAKRRPGYWRGRF